MEMSVETATKYWKAINNLEAQEMLQWLTILDWPEMKRDKRQTMHKALWRAAWPDSMRPRNFITPQEAMKKYNGK